MEDVGVEFAQGSGETIPAEVFSTKLTENDTSEQLSDTWSFGSHSTCKASRCVLSYLLQSFLGKLTSRM